ncbi:hypothetical protein DACRYDRAFT_99289 [Dacryopinax primogenitus]|uniref:Peroxin domain-containing protein n=1 Tax=Dacryopinax primogenitus (strain DJM 731) TaxID=1858805 RepID=M5G6D9_DACPD|nr:uncharacterized protein DACRYDRAFT_99289 [Dacryopinax primogenitus]EJU03770.1 hypothetical protein DACRYDRAFT_99289 [Dacryopinax primogenitus]
MILLLPHLALLCVLLPSYLRPERDAPQVPPLPIEGSTEWLANVQAIQNLMGFASDIYDLALPLLPHLTQRTVYSIPLTRFLSLSVLLLLPFLPYLPLRPIFLCLGLSPFLLTHPSVLPLHPHLLAKLHSLGSLVALKAKDDDALTCSHWTARAGGERTWGLIETWERETFRLPEGASEQIGKQWLPEGLRSAFEVALIPGWETVDEGWVCDFFAGWAGGGADGDGWVYADELGRPLDPLLGKGVLRRRRWTRRIWRVPKEV